MYSLISFFTRVEFYTSENDYGMQKGAHAHIWSVTLDVL